MATEAKETAYLVKERSFIAKLAARKLRAERVAIVIGKTVHLHNTSRREFLANAKWVRHEEVHLEQFRRYGFVKFICMYLWESFRKGYWNNKFEIEARESESGEGHV